MAETTPEMLAYLTEHQLRYPPLVSEYQAILRLALRNDSELDWGSPVMVHGKVKENAAVRMVPGDVIPSGRATPAVAGTWMPDRQLLDELLARTLENRSRRWLHDERRYLALPLKWPEVVRRRWPGQFDCELSIGQGWVDLLIATHMWLDELGADFRWSQIKQKFGGARLYFDGDVGVRGNDIITTAEDVLSYCLSERCGAPGSKRSIRGWYVTRCDDHALSGA